MGGGAGHGGGGGGATHRPGVRADEGPRWGLASRDDHAVSGCPIRVPSAEVVNSADDCSSITIMCMYMWLGPSAKPRDVSLVLARLLGALEFCSCNGCLRIDSLGVP